MTDYERILRDFIKATKSAQSEYKYYYAKVNELDKATGDILHQFELGDSKERAKWATKVIIHTQGKTLRKGYGCGDGAD